MSIEITVANAIGGMSGFQLTIEVNDASVAEIVGVAFPNYGEVDLGPPIGFVPLTEVGPLPASSVIIAATELDNVITSLSAPQVLATLSVELLSPGATQLTVSQQPLQLDDESGRSISPLLFPG